MSIISTHQLCKAFGARLAVDRLELCVPSQTVFAFLGGNGAGKSTTIRLLLGLLTPSLGRVSLFGETLTIGNRRALLKRIGSLVETPSLYGNLSGRDNLRLNQRVLKCAPSHIDRVLRLMGLLDAADRKVAGYSLGMKQRLGLALALLHEPELIILDEPTNGLDPSGIREIRDLIRQLPSLTGATVFVSSHLLDEVEKMAEHVAILHQGRLRFQGTLTALRAQSVLELRGLDRQVIERTLGQLSYPFQHDTRNDLWLVQITSLEETANLSNRLVVAGAGLTHLNLRQSGLESLFFSITEGHEVEPPSVAPWGVSGASHV